MKFKTNVFASVVSGYLLCDKGEMYQAYASLAGRAVASNQIGRAFRAAEKTLPRLGLHFGDLNLLCDITPREARKRSAAEWFSGEVERLALPEEVEIGDDAITAFRAAFGNIDPLAELEAQFGDRVIAVVA